MQETIVPGVSMWSRWQPDRRLDFNSYYVRGEGGAFVVDPLEPDDEILAAVGTGGIDAIVITNRDHERFAARFVAEFGVPVIASEPDAALLSVSVARAVRDGDDVYGWRVIVLDGFKTAGEMVLVNRRLAAAISGDAFWGAPAGALRLMADEKLQNPERAYLSARRVRALPIDALLVGDGAPVFRDAPAVLGRALDARDGIALNRINLDELVYREYYRQNETFGASDAEVGLLLGASNLGYRAAKIPPGKSFCPYHWHTSDDEIYIVWEGTATLRTPRGTFPIRRGDIIGFSAGPGGAHRVYNESDAECTIIMIGNTDVHDVCFYPDSRKVLVEAADLMVRSEPELAYLEGE